MSRSLWLWIVAVLVTLFAARYQRVTGPTYPVSGSAALGASTFRYRLERTHAGAGDQRVSVTPGDAAAQGVLEWRPLAASDWSRMPMTRQGDALAAAIPHQPIATKVAYRVRLSSGAGEIVLPPRDPAVLRFRGDVPAWILIPHILAMFAAMLYSTRAGLETLAEKPAYGMLVFRTIAALLVGGIVLGCVVAWYAFRAPWGGFPISNDPTDNKTLLALIVWAGAALALRFGRTARGFVALASLVTLIVYMVPHSIAAPR